MAKEISDKKNSFHQNLSRRRLDKFRLAIIGMGHIGSALHAGLLRAGVKSSRIVISKSSKTNAAAARAADWIFIAVKPGMVHTVLKEIQNEIKRKVVISLAAGITKSMLKKYASRSRVARVMPNMPIAVNQGVVGYLAGNLTLEEKKELVKMLSLLGVALQAKDDRELEALTLISGCGPGIVAYLVSMLAENARRLGIKESESQKIALQIFKGTFSYMEKNLVSAERLITSVATKGGVTEAILQNLSRSGFKKNFAKALKIGHARIKKLQK